MKTETLFMSALAAASLSLAAPAFAHPKLVSSTPAASTTVNAPGRISLTFSERLMPRLSGLEVSMSGMPGMTNHAPMKISNVTTAVAEDGKTLVATFARPLGAGTYKIDWHVVSADTHRIAGSFAFTVR